MSYAARQKFLALSKRLSPMFAGGVVRRRWILVRIASRARHTRII
jgi:hypothetical protein